jgi:hypothetical protein
VNKTLQELKEFSSDFILERFSHQNDIEKLFSDFLGFDVNFEDQECGYMDYEMGVNLDLDDKLLYFDVLYLIDRDSNIVITEFVFDSDYVLNGNDLDKIITPLKEDSNE